MEETLHRIVDASVVLNLFDSGLSIHDDIIDKTLRKRFRLTTLETRGVEYAVLVGDLLIVKAWSLLCEMMNKSGKSRIASFARAYEKFFHRNGRRGDYGDFLQKELRY